MPVPQEVPLPRILVPLDESELAESALPWAAELARVLGLSLHLVAVYDYDEEGWRKAGIDTEAGPTAIAATLQAYLEQSVGRPPFSGLEHTSEVRMGDVSDQLTDAALEGDTRFIVLASQGEGGLSRFRRGSVADALVREGTTPVLIVRQGGRAAAFRRVLVTLDGSDVSEVALGPAREIADAAGAEVHLMRVINPVVDSGWTGVGPAPDMGLITEQLTESAIAYLQGRARPIERADVLFGRPLDAILQYAEEHDCDVIVMGSHGRGGIVRLALGSTADAVMRASDRPVLIIPHRAVEE